MISLTHNGTLPELNQKARRILDEKDGIWLSGSNLTLENNQESRELQSMIRKALADSSNNSGPAVVEGLTLDGSAEKLNVRRNTARTHLRSIFCKTGVTRQTMLSACSSTARLLRGEDVTLPPRNVSLAV